MTWQEKVKQLMQEQNIQNTWKQTVFDKWRKKYG